MRTIAALLLLLRGAGAVAPVGVCWTRNMVDNATARHDLRYVVASARSLRRRAPAVPRCLFTDASPAALAGAGAAGLFDAVLADGGAAFAGRNAGEVALLDPDARGVGAKRRRELAKLRSRVGRILNVARGPYELTLFADDDTYFCDGEALEAALADLHRRRDAHAVRARVMPKASGERRVVEEARRCVWSHASRARDYSAPLEAKCVDRADRSGRGFCAGAQGGALAVARGAAAAAFAADWLDAYLRLYAREAKDPARLQRAQVESFAADQAPLARAMAANCDRGDGARWSVRQRQRLRRRFQDFPGRHVLLLPCQRRHRHRLRLRHLQRPRIFSQRPEVWRGETRTFRRTRTSRPSTATGRDGVHRSARARAHAFHPGPSRST